MSRSRRPSVSTHDYPEHLNPFNEDIGNTQSYSCRDVKTKEPKHKFWTFGRSRKKRSNSFSIKSTWNGLFGKRKEDKPEMQEKRSTITTVSSTYKREPYVRPLPPPRVTKDQQEFDEALGTLVRRRKYTLDNSASRYGSSLTVNGDPARLYDGSPKDTTTSIMGDLTPKPPARRFGQVSPKPTDKIPPLDFDEQEPKENGSVTLREKTQERTPVPPLRRFGNRASQRSNVIALDSEEEASRSGDVTMCDENENVPGDFAFKRCSQDAVRKSNLSINSCVSIGSTMSSYGRKKRRAPQPPRPRPENVETIEKVPEAPNIELQIVEPTDIARVTENIDDLTKKSKELAPEAAEGKVNSVVSASDDTRPSEEANTEDNSPKVVENNTETSPFDEENASVENQTNSLEEKETSPGREKNSPEREKDPQETEKTSPETEKDSQETEKDSQETEKTSPETEKDSQETEKTSPEREKTSPKKEQPETETFTEDQMKPEEAVTESAKKNEEDVQVEYRRTSQENIQIIKDVDQENLLSELDDVCLRKKGSSGSLSRADSFSVKDEIEKIERQIKALETRNANSEERDANSFQENTRHSIQENRRHFFKNLVGNEQDKGPIKIEFKEFPREQKDIHVVRLNDSPIPTIAPREPVKVIELHISEPIRQKPELLDDVNPLPKPRRHSALSLNNSQSNSTPTEARRSIEPIRGQSL